MAGGPPPLRSSGSTALKNIVIGVITTVLASSIVYFLGFQNKQADKDEIQKKKEATMDAWNSLMFYEKQFRETGTRMVCLDDTSEMSDRILIEYDKIIKNISNIEKVANVDNRLVSLIDRRIATLTDKRKATADYNNTILSTDISEDTAAAIALYNNFISKMNAFEYRDTAFINGVSNELTKKYNTKFSIPGPTIITPELLFGNWTVDRDKYLNLKKDNTFSFNMDSIDYPGRWSLDNLTLHFNFFDGSSIDYIINSGGQNFLLTNDGNGTPHFFCR
ncbi:MAG: hypothetical protein JST10_16925 [Bacteroidetes bacterium]|nr:hypothetical protein [Bacteroidota bacterium]MBS1634246.1 hypothetical protein [Bacteroidota bacterium]